MIEVNRCSKCGQRPTVHQFNHPTISYKILCCDCHRSTCEHPTFEEAARSWNKQNQEKEKRSPRLVKCMACNKYPQNTYHEPGTYEFYCETCHMSSGLHSTFEFAEQRWEEINTPNIERSGVKSGRYPWHNENSKILAKQSTPPKEQLFFLEDRIRELSSAIADMLNWIDNIEKLSAIYSNTDNWANIEKWAKEIAAMTKVRKEYLDGATKK